MIGRIGEVKLWRDLAGQIFINGELWNGRCDIPLVQGDKAFIERVEGFVLRVRKVPTVCHSRWKK
jgi:membrane protein implicated in regulation of membrane protease activity